MSIFISGEVLVNTESGGQCRFIIRFSLIKNIVSTW